MSARVDEDDDAPFTQSMWWVLTPCGSALYVRVYTANYRRLYWSEIHDAFTAVYPGKWAVESLPPRELTVDEKNIYHLLVFDECPKGFDLFDDARANNRARVR